MFRSSHDYPMDPKASKSIVLECIGMHWPFLDPQMQGKYPPGMTCTISDTTFSQGGHRPDKRRW